MRNLLKLSIAIAIVLSLTGCIHNPMPAGATAEHPPYNEG